MLFLYRPRETWMPFARPMSRTQQMAYNRQLQQRFESTRRVAPAVPAAMPAGKGELVSGLENLNELHRVGALTDEQFESAKAKLLAK